MAGVREMLAIRPCGVPQESVAIPDGYAHYPVTDADLFELYDDLRIEAGLTDRQAIETVGFAAIATWANCGNSRTRMGEDHRQQILEWGEFAIKTVKLKRAFGAGVKLADEERRDV